MAAVHCYGLLSSVHSYGLLSISMSCCLWLWSDVYGNGLLSMAMSYAWCVVLLLSLVLLSLLLCQRPVAVPLLVRAGRRPEGRVAACSAVAVGTAAAMGRFIAVNSSATVGPAVAVAGAVNADVRLVGGGDDGRGGEGRRSTWMTSKDC